jgi:hypothetical protein
MTLVETTHEFDRSLKFCPTQVLRMSLNTTQRNTPLDIQGVREPDALGVLKLFRNILIGETHERLDIADNWRFHLLGALGILSKNHSKVY